MQKQFRAISLSYKKASLNVREQISLDEQEAGNLLRQLKDVLDLSEALVLSTCNRTEIYYTATESLSFELIKLLSIQKNLASPLEIASSFQVYDTSPEAMEHLFRVSIGLESQVVGDLQIINQVKRAYQLTADLELAGPYLHRLMHTIFFTNKRVVQETAFRDGAASVSYATVEMIEEVCKDFIIPNILVVGLGEIGSDVVKNLHQAGIENITIANRTHSKSLELAASCGYSAIKLDDVWEFAQSADVIICSVGTSTPFFSLNKVKSLGIKSHKYFFDLAVPRSVEQGVDKLSNVLVYNVDDINNRASETIDKRKAAIPQVESIILEAIQEFSDWSQSMLFSPTINKIKQGLEQIRQEEMGKHLKKLSEAEMKTLDKITKGMMQKILTSHVLQFKAACKRGEAETLVGVINELFNLEKNTQAK